jgi:hypothetical protein
MLSLAPAEPSDEVVSNIVTGPRKETTTGDHQISFAAFSRMSSVSTTRISNFAKKETGQKTFQRSEVFPGANPIIYVIQIDCHEYINFGGFRPKFGCRIRGFGDNFYPRLRRMNLFANLITICCCNFPEL